MGKWPHYAVNFFPSIKNNCGMVKLGTHIAENFTVSKNKFSNKAEIIDFQLLEESMDKVVEECSRDSIRSSMLKHEKIFREQVSELHRLYKVQKLLMAEVSKDLELHRTVSAKSTTMSDAKSRIQSSRSLPLTNCVPPQFDRHKSTAQLNNEYNFHHFLNSRASQGSHRVSICSGETAMTSSSSFKQQPDIAEDNNLDLTLSIGCGSSRTLSRCESYSNRASESTYDEARDPILSEVTRAKKQECSEAHVSFDSEVLQRSPWPFQSLGLNRT